MKKKKKMAAVLPVTIAIALWAHIIGKESPGSRPGKQSAAALFSLICNPKINRT
jgi:hypothetical protein